MNFLFCNILPPDCMEGITQFSPGIAFLSAVLKQHGHSTSLIYIRKLDKKSINKKIAEFRPDIIGYSFNSYQVSLVN